MRQHVLVYSLTSKHTASHGSPGVGATVEVAQDLRAHQRSLLDRNFTLLLCASFRGDQAGLSLACLSFPLEPSNRVHSVHSNLDFGPGDLSRRTQFRDQERHRPSMEQHPNVWDGVQGAVATVGSNVANNWQNLVRHCGRQLHPWQRNLSSFAAGLQQQLVPLQAGQQQQRQRRGQQQHCWSPALAVSGPITLLWYADAHVHKRVAVCFCACTRCKVFARLCGSLTLESDHVVHAAKLYALLHLLHACLQSISFGRGPANSSNNSQAGNSSSSSVTAQPLFDLGMPKDEVKARLAPIPVYTVANPKNEFVLVAGENNTQLGFFFFQKEDAEAIVAKIREENPRLARDSKVLRVTMDNVYEVFTTPRETTGLQGIHFRFMPDMSQVKHALQLYKEAGVPTKSFVGVPVFQAEGLTVTTQDMQYVPLFLTKEDLDVAVGGAYRQRNASQISAVKEKAALYEEEYQTALKEVRAAAVAVCVCYFDVSTGEEYQVALMGVRGLLWLCVDVFGHCGCVYVWCGYWGGVSGCAQRGAAVVAWCGFGRVVGLCNVGLDEACCVVL
eukprot:GHRQ01022827.1.p1 GENE.GHRQ01022827.1~~GHRQ01022827.1.p1  ORF type:complete len:558 (+),score=134.92 GHRQ01022827.1:56-1729(+)